MDAKQMNFLRKIQIYVERTNKTLLRFMKLQPFQNIPLLHAMKYGTLLGGKRLRPFLIYAIGNMFGVNNETLDALAASIECIHAYSLIHDDLPAMDNSTLRRGLPTCHIKFNEANAILAGNALQSLAFYILSTAPMKNVSDQNRLSMISELSIASGVAGICGGQALDLDLTEAREKVTLEKLEYIYHYKTGALIRAAVRISALSASNNFNRYILTVLDNYAECISLAFQIQDDILDVIGDTKILGKHCGIDQKINKMTYPTLVGIDLARNKARELINNSYTALEKLSLQSFDISLLKELANYIIQRDK